jgi:hypothetical protein
MRSQRSQSLTFPTAVQAVCTRSRDSSAAVEAVSADRSSCAARRLHSHRAEPSGAKPSALIHILSHNPNLMSFLPRPLFNNLKHAQSMYTSLTLFCKHAQAVYTRSRDSSAAVEAVSADRSSSTARRLHSCHPKPHGAEPRAPIYLLAFKPYKLGRVHSAASVRCHTGQSRICERESECPHNAARRSAGGQCVMAINIVVCLMFCAWNVVSSEFHVVICDAQRSRRLMRRKAGWCLPAAARMRR